MGNPTNPACVKLITGIIFHNEDLFSAVLKEMVSSFGSLDFVSETMPFDFTDYYEEEMGKNLRRRMVSFETLITPERISSIKRLTNGIEASVSASPERREVNIDPGYINAYHLILATTKSAPHRPYLQEGIYADLTLVFQEKNFRALPWTYPDYQEKKMIALLRLYLRWA